MRRAASSLSTATAIRPLPAPSSRISPPCSRALPGDTTREEVGSLGSGDEVPVHAELHAAGAVIAETRGVQGQLHETLEGQPAAGAQELCADMCTQTLAVRAFLGRERRQH